MNVFELFGTIALNGTDKFNSDVDGASNKASAFASKLGSGLKTAAKVGAAAVTAVATAATAMTTAFIKGTSDVAQYGDNIDKMSQKMGLSAEAYQEWDFIMQHSGTSIESLQTGMKTLANAVESGNDAFTRLGITQADIAGMNNEELFSATITALQQVENETERTYLAGQLLGRGATELGALLNTSAEDTEAMRQQVHELGGVMSDEAVKAAAAYQDSLQNMQTAFSGISRGLLSEFLPSMVSVMDGLALIFSGDDSGIEKVAEGVKSFTDQLMLAIPKIFELGGSILSSLATAILENLPILVSTATDVILKLVAGLIDALPLIVGAALQIVQSLTTGLSENIGTIAESAVELITVLSEGLIELLPEIVEIGLNLIVSLATGIANSLPKLIPSLVETIVMIAKTLTEPDMLSKILDAALTLIINLAYGLMDAIPQLVDACIEVIINLVEFLIDPDNIAKLLNAALHLVIALGTGLINAIPQLMTSTGRLIKSLIDNFKETDWGQVGKDLIDGLLDGLKSAWESIKKWFSNAWDSLFGGKEVEIDASVNESSSGEIHRTGHATGLDYVPYDNYPANLHKGEMVLPANQADYLRTGAMARSNDEIVEVLLQILDAVQGVDMSGMSLNINNREFARMVKAVN